MDVTVVLHPTSGGADITIGTKAGQKLAKLKNGGTATVTVPVTVATGLASGDYTIIANVTPNGFAPTASAAAQGGRVTVTGGSNSSGGDKVWLHGDVVTFKATSTVDMSPVFIQLGTFTTNEGVTGTYKLTSGDLMLSYTSTGDGEDYLITFNTKPVSFNNKKVTFSFDSAGSIATMPNRGAHNDQTAYVKFG